MKYTKGLISSRMKYVFYNLPKALAKFLRQHLPKKMKLMKILMKKYLIWKAKDWKKIVKPSNEIDIYSRLEVLLGLKLSGHTHTLTEASNLIDELYKRGEIQNEQHYRNALNKFFTKQMQLTSEILK